MCHANLAFSALRKCDAWLGPVCSSICDWVNNYVTFNYQQARPTKTALEVYSERVGVCRDFQHLAITFCRALNIPARYATGYLGDIPDSGAAAGMDFSAWFEVWLVIRQPVVGI